MSQNHQIWCVATPHGKPAWYCIWVTWTQFQGQQCEFHHINHIPVITRGDALGSPNLLCRYLSCKTCLGLYLGQLDTFSINTEVNFIARERGARITKFLLLARFPYFFRLNPAKIGTDISRGETHHLCGDGPDWLKSLDFNSNILSGIG